MKARRHVSGDAFVCAHLQGPYDGICWRQDVCGRVPWFQESFLRKPAVQVATRLPFADSWRWRDAPAPTLRCSATSVAKTMWSTSASACARARVSSPKATRSRKAAAVTTLANRIKSRARPTCRARSPTPWLAPLLGTARIFTAVEPPMVKSSIVVRSAPRIRPCLCQAMRASPICAMLTRLSCASTIGVRITAVA